MNYVLKNPDLNVEISSLGAELRSIYYPKHNFEYLWQGDPQYWTGRAPLLFPFVGRFKENKYQIDDQFFDTPQHGFARINEFQIEQMNDTRLIARLMENEDTLKIYPYKFLFEVEYILYHNEIHTNYTVTNTDDKDIYFTFGLHPAFNLDDTIENTCLELEDEDLISYLKIEYGYFIAQEKFYGRKTLNLYQDIFKDDAVVFDNLHSRKAVLNFKNSFRKVTMTWDEKMPILAFWSKPNAPFVCIEPWVGRSDNREGQGDKIQEKNGMILLGKGEKYSFVSSIIVD